MHISKLTKKVIRKYGSHVTFRYPFILPLNENPEVYEIPGFVQLVPFTKLVVEYLNMIGADVKLFPFGRRWAWEIIRECTGRFPHWFRAQSEMIYGNLLKDSVKLAKFVGVVRPEQVAQYIGFDYKTMLKSGS